MKSLVLVLCGCLTSTLLAAPAAPGPTTRPAIQTLDNSAELAVDMKDAAVEVLVNGRSVLRKEKPESGEDFVTISDMVRNGKNSVTVRWLPREQPAASPGESISVEVTVIRTIKRAGDAFMPLPLKKKDAKVDPSKPRDQQSVGWDFTIDNYPLDDLIWLHNTDRKYTDKDSEAVKAAAKPLYDAVAARDEKAVANLLALKYQRQAKVDEVPLADALTTWQSMWKRRLTGDDFAIDPWKPDDLVLTKLDGINLVRITRKGDKARAIAYKVRGRDTGIAELYAAFVDGAWKIVD